LKLTKRDKEIILTLYKQRFLKASHIEKLFFNSKSRMQRRLKELVEENYLKRIRFKKSTGEGTDEFIYSVGKESIPVVAEWTNDNVKNVKNIVMKKTPAGLSFYAHTLAEANTMIMFNEIEGAKWWGELEWKALIGNSPTLIPDGFVKFEEDGFVENYCIEVDLGTMRTAAFQRKLNRYVNYINDKNQNDFENLTILVLTNDGNRIEYLKKATRKTRKKTRDEEKLMIGVLFTTFDRGIKGRVWENIHSDKKSLRFN